MKSTQKEVSLVILALNEERTARPSFFPVQNLSHLPFNFLVRLMLGAFQLTNNRSDFHWVVLSSGRSPWNFILCALIENRNKPKKEKGQHILTHNYNVNQ